MTESDPMSPRLLGFGSTSSPFGGGATTGAGSSGGSLFGNTSNSFGSGGMSRKVFSVARLLVITNWRVVYSTYSGGRPTNRPG